MFCIVLFDTFKKVRVKRKNRIQTAIGQSNSSIILGFSTFIFFFFALSVFLLLPFLYEGHSFNKGCSACVSLSLFVYEVLVELLLFFFFVGEQTA